ncbi:hypothetical protein BDB01DRAFT_228121 [Pilobolus umbonatus]|nr:hypothetical protein BDB01DRAFT_228121 [Pilobolus umbonatus]
MVDVRFARFLPLSRMLYLEEIHSSHLSEEEIHKSSASDPEPFVDLTGSSIPSVQSPLNIYSQESNYGETQLTASQITAMYILPGPSISSSSQNDNLIHEMTDEEVLTEDIKSLPPDFNELSLPDLKEAVKKYGFKASSNRSEMIKVLETIWQSVHNTPSNSQILSEVDDIDLLRMEEDEIESTIKNKIIEHLKSKPLLWQKILKYEAVDLDECCEGTDFKKADIKAVLGGFNVMIKSKKETRAI